MFVFIHYWLIEYENLRRDEVFDLIRDIVLHGPKILMYFADFAIGSVPFVKRH